MERSPLGETVQDFILEIGPWAVICLVGVVFIFMWGEHRALLIVGFAMFAGVGGWFGYVHRKFIDSESSTWPENPGCADGGSTHGARRLRCVPPSSAPAEGIAFTQACGLANAHVVHSMPHRCPVVADCHRPRRELSRVLTENVAELGSPWRAC